jgi:hypothetical protein
MLFARPNRCPVCLIALTLVLQGGDAFAQSAGRLANAAHGRVAPPRRNPPQTAKTRQAVFNPAQVTTRPANFTYSPAPGQKFNGYVQPGSNWSAGGSYQGPSSRGNGRLSPTSGGFSYGNSQGQQASGGYQTGPNWSFQGSYSDGRGTGYNGALSRTSGSGGYHDPKGNDVGGGYTYRNPQNFQVSGHYYTPSVGYGGYAGKQNGNVVVGGEYRSPIVVGGVPVAQQRIGADARFAGRNSTLDGRYQVYDPTGSVRLGGANAQLDRQKLGVQGSAGIYSGNGQVRFSGVNSTVSASGRYGVDGLNYSGNASVNRQGVSAGVGGQVGGARVGVNVSVDGHGVHGGVTAPQVRVPPVSLPALPSVPTPSLPSVSLPSFSNPF